MSFALPENILIIDNGSHYIHHLERICGDSLRGVVTPGEINPEKVENYDAVFLSGGFVHEVMGGEEFYGKEIELVKRGKVPIVGVCLGFQIIAHAYGMPVHKMPRREHSTILINPTKIGEEIIGIGPFEVYENHRWVLSKAPEDFHALATSKDGIESIIHATKPIVGFQFHPEMFVTKNDGREILLKALEYAYSRSKV